MSTCLAVHSSAPIRQRAGLLTTASNPLFGVPDPTFTGWYVEGSWFFGGHKTYEDEGNWGRPKINNPMFHGSGGWGGLQLVGKYDVLEQSDQRASTMQVWLPQRRKLYPGLSSTGSGKRTSAANSIAAVRRS